MTPRTDRYRRIRRYTMAAVAATLTFSLAACAGESSTPAADIDTTVLTGIFGEGGEDAGEGLTIPVGALTSVTGQAATFGESMSNGINLAAAQIKAAGGPDFKVTIGDHKGDVTAGTQQFRRITTQEGAKVMLISFINVGEALAPLIAQNKILSFQGGGTSAGQLGKDYLWNNRSVAAVSQVPGALAWLAQEYPDAKKLAIVGTQQNAAYSMEELVPQYWPELVPGGEVVATEYNDYGATDFSQVIARLKASQPDVIMSFEYSDDVGYFTKQLRDSGLQQPLIGLEFLPSACEIAGAAYDEGFTVVADYFDPEAGPWAEYFQQTYEETYGAEPDYYAANYYEEMFILWELVQDAIAAGSDPQDPTVLQDILEQKTEFTSLYGGSGDQVGEMTVDLDQHVFDKPMAIYGVKDCTEQPPVAYAKYVAPDSGEDPATALIPIQ